MADKRAYERYDSMLSAYFNGNRSVTASEQKQWQNAMKALRTKWEQQGESFPHSANEDRY